MWVFWLFLLKYCVDLNYEFISFFEFLVSGDVLVVCLLMEIEGVVLSYMDKEGWIVLIVVVMVENEKVVDIFLEDLILDFNYWD